MCLPIKTSIVRTRDFPFLVVVSTQDVFPLAAVVKRINFVFYVLFLSFVLYDFFFLFFNSKYSNEKYKGDGPDPLKNPRSDGSSIQSQLQSLMLPGTTSTSPAVCLRNSVMV